MLPYSNNKDVTIINMLGGPGVGKSTTALGLAYYMSLAQKGKVEYVPEVAKDYTFEGRHHMLTEQDYIFSKQNNRFRRLVGQVDYIVADTSLLLGFMYMPKDFPPSFFDYVMDTYNSYNNINVLIRRGVPYETVGRNQDENEAIQIDKDLRALLIDTGVPFFEVDNVYGKNVDTVHHIMNDLVYKNV